MKLIQGTAKPPPAGPIGRETIKGVTRLLTREEVIRVLGLESHPNPHNAIRWMIRTRKLKPTPIMRGVMRFHPDDVQATIDAARK